jgi:hypothetical protein
MQKLFVTINVNGFRNSGKFDEPEIHGILVRLRLKIVNYETLKKFGGLQIPWKNAQPEFFRSLQNEELRNILFFDIYLVDGKRIHSPGQ